jgi:lipoprotein-anchoring transpeptidase ErfK/SrfK
LAVYQDNRLVFATMISSGTGEFYTRQGVFQIERKLETEDMSGAFTADKSDFYYLEDVPWTMYYDGARAIHGAYWHDGFGFKQSHGCVNLSVADAYWLFKWAHEGDWVYVWDPTGETPFE